jgi:hypothetical protein
MVSESDNEAAARAVFFICLVIVLATLAFAFSRALDRIEALERRVSALEPSRG